MLPPEAGAAPRAPSAHAEGGSGAAQGLGQFPTLALVAGAGLLLCSVVEALSRATLAPEPVFYWAGVLLIGVPIFFRLASEEATPRERLALVVLLGLSLYAVKLIRDPLVFTFPDEPIHAFNADQIVSHHELFRHNPLLPASPDYPGLEGVASALMSLTGISSYGAGVVVIGAARLILMVGLFILFGRISGSGRIAGIATAAYAGSANFLLWGVQFAYQSLALPMLVVLLALLAEHQAAPAGSRRPWAVAIVVITAAIVITHHLTSYALIAALITLAILHYATGERRDSPNPWPFAAVAAVLAGLWLATAAGSTVDYLSPVVSRTLHSIGDTVTGGKTRALFQGSGANSAGGDVGSTPAIPRAIALASVAILGIGMVFGLLQLWRVRRRDPFTLLFCLASFGFFATLLLRFAPASWETGNRAADLMFIGLAFVLAIGFGAAYSRLAGRPARAPWLGRFLLSSSFAVVLVGGAISGWPWDVQLADPVKARAGGARFESEPLALARWTSTHLPGSRFAAPNADALLLEAYGDVTVRAGRRPDIEDLLTNYRLEPWQKRVLRRYKLRYVVADRRRRAGDVVRGYSASVHPPAGARDSLFRINVTKKYEASSVGRVVLPHSARIFDSGKIAVYDTEAQP